MTVYVDDYRVPATVGRIRARWSHLFVPAGTDLEELHQFAESVGLRRSWFQGPPAHRFPHYDVTDSKRTLAITLGARECSFLESPGLISGRQAEAG